MPMRQQSGFTLIETLLLVVILTIIAGAAVLSVDLAGSQTSLNRDVARLAELMTLHCQQAELIGQATGVVLATDGYGFVHRRGEDWGLVEDKPFLPRPFDSVPSVDLVVGGYQATIESTLESVLLEASGPRSDLKPQLICFASGELTPFEMTLVRDELSATLRGDLRGGLETTDAG